MSNPLLHPSDPRFQKPEICDAAGKNRFSDEDARTNPARVTSDAYAPSASDDAQPFAPQYAVQQNSRGDLLLFFGGLGWGAAAIGAFSFTGWFDAGWLSPILGLAFASAAWYMAHDEFKAIRAGAISAAAEPKVRHAYWLGLTGLVACLAIVVAMIGYEMRWFPAV